MSLQPSTSTSQLQIPVNWSRLVLFAVPLAVILFFLIDTSFWIRNSDYINRHLYPWTKHPYDWALHFCGYCSLTFFFGLVGRYSGRLFSGWPGAWRMGVAVLVIATTDEITQIWHPHRNASVSDWLANLAAVATGTACLLLVEALWPIQPKGGSRPLAGSGWSIAQAYPPLLQLARLRYRSKWDLPPPAPRTQDAGDIPTAGAVAAPEDLVAGMEARGTDALASAMLRTGQSAVFIEGLPSLGPGADGLTAALTAACRDQRRREAAGALLRQHQTQALLQALAAAKIDCMPFKGDWLGETLELPFGSRPACDLDLLVRPADFEAALRVCAAAGCKPATTDPAAVAYLRDFKHDFPLTHSVLQSVEIHTRLLRDLPPHAGEQLWAGAHKARFWDADIYEPDPNDLLVVLCVHLFQHGWLADIKWAVDILGFMEVLAAQLSSAIPPPKVPSYLRTLNLARVQARAAEWGAGFRMAAVLWLLNRDGNLGYDSRLLTAFDGELNSVEQQALAHLRGPQAGQVTVEWLVYQARKARTVDPERSTLFATLWPHRGRVALDMQVASTSPLFAWHRLRWFAGRLGRGVAAVLRTPKSQRRTLEDEF